MQLFLFFTKIGQSGLFLSQHLSTTVYTIIIILASPTHHIGLVKGGISLNFDSMLVNTTRNILSHYAISTAVN